MQSDFDFSPHTYENYTTHSPEAQQYKSGYPAQAPIVDQRGGGYPGYQESNPYYPSPQYGYPAGSGQQPSYPMAQAAYNPYQYQVAPQVAPQGSLYGLHGPYNGYISTTPLGYPTPGSYSYPGDYSAHYPTVGLVAQPGYHSQLPMGQPLYTTFRR